ncbi:hypothetical protein ACXHH4_005594 [Pseudomonas aeruginosa]
MREEFEAWIRTQVPEPSHATALAYSAGNDLYLNPHIQGRYEGWKASRAALRVELPPEMHAGDLFEDTPIYNASMIKVILQQAGIEVAE